MRGDPAARRGRRVTESARGAGQVDLAITSGPPSSRISLSAALAEHGSRRRSPPPARRRSKRGAATVTPESPSRGGARPRVETSRRSHSGTADRGAGRGAVRRAAPSRPVVPGPTAQSGRELSQDGPSQHGGEVQAHTDLRDQVVHASRLLLRPRTSVPDAQMGRLARPGGELLRAAPVSNSSEARCSRRSPRLDTTRSRPQVAARLVIADQPTDHVRSRGRHCSSIPHSPTIIIVGYRHRLVRGAARARQRVRPRTSLAATVVSELISSSNSFEHLIRRGVSREGPRPSYAAPVHSESRD